MHKLQKFLIVLAFIFFTGTGYLTVSALTSCPAEAVSCSCVACISATPGVSGALLAIHSLIVIPALNEAQAQLMAYFAAAVQSVVDKVGLMITWLMKTIVTWFDTFWYYNLLPSFQMMTDQLSVSNVEQARAVGSFMDAAAIDHIERMLENMAIEDHREQRPGENVCVAGTVAGGMTRAAAFGRAYNAAAPVEMLPRSANRVGTTSENSGRSDAADRWSIYVSRYCRRDFNNGTSGCTADQPFADQDLDIAGNIFLKDTIDLTDVETKTTLDHLILNLAEPFAHDPVMKGAVDTAEGHIALLEKESYKTRRQLIYDSLYHVVSRRAPGSSMRPFIEAIRDEAGLVMKTSPNPSRHEVMQALIAERFRSGKYALRQVGEPENNRREMVIQQALQLMQMKDQLDLMDRYSLLLAAQAGAAVDLAKPSGAAVEDAPLSGAP